MRTIILILCYLCGNYGDDSPKAQNSDIVVTFNVSIKELNASCKPLETELKVEEGRRVILNASRVYIQQEQKEEEIQRLSCTFSNGSHQDFVSQQSTKEPWKEEQTITKHLYGNWTCELQFNGNIGNYRIKPYLSNYSYVMCNIIVKKPDASLSAPATPDSEKSKELWYIVGGIAVGVIVLLIIIGQTIALCYFRRKAQPRRRMDTMTPGSTEDDDHARYSAPPCKKRKSSVKAEADRDSHIYEMVGINALYTKSSDLNPETSTDSADKNIRDRPPLPLPHEIPKPAPVDTLPRKKTSVTSMTSNMSFNSISSGSNQISKNKGKELPPPPRQAFKKVQPLSPNQIDEIPGSLHRPPKPTPAPAPAAVSAPASAKNGTIPETSSAYEPATKSPMSELKNLFKKRNVGKDTPTSSPAATLERKEPPKVQGKPNTLTKSKTQKQPLNVASKPAVKLTNQPNSEAPRLPVPKTSEPSSSPITLKPKKKPSKSVRNRPLPTPESGRKLSPKPISPQPISQLPPIYKSADEDLSRDTDDEEEWTYEALGQYNIYNI